VKHLADPWRSDGDRLAHVLDKIDAFYRRFVAFTNDAQPVAATLWTAHTHLLDVAYTTPRLSVRSPEKRSGKTRLLECMELLVYAALRVVSMSEAALFRLVATEAVVLLWDEVDSIFGPQVRDHKEDLRALLNVGYQRGAVVVRMVGEGKKMRVEKFPVFAPAALTGIGTLPDTIEDRCIVIDLRRRRRDEPVEKFRADRMGPQMAPLRQELIEACAAVKDQVALADPAMPPGLHDRAEDCWAPLLAVADAAGDRWAKRARDAAVRLTTEHEEESLGLQLLADCRDVFDELGADLVTPTDLAGRLADLEESPWGTYGKTEKPITANRVSRMLGSYGIHTRPTRVGKARGRYFHADDFLDPWDRYLSPPRDERVDALTTETPQGPYATTDVNASTHFPRGGHEKGPAVAAEDDLGAWTSDRDDDEEDR
jgi:hypothetical protein